MAGLQPHARHTDAGAGALPPVLTHTFGSLAVQSRALKPFLASKSAQSAPPYPRDLICAEPYPLSPCSVAPPCACAPAPMCAPHLRRSLSPACTHRPATECNTPSFNTHPCRHRESCEMSLALASVRLFLSASNINIECDGARGACCLIPSPPRPHDPH